MINSSFKIVHDLSCHPVFSAHCWLSAGKQRWAPILQSQSCERVMLTVVDLLLLGEIAVVQAMLFIAARFSIACSVCLCLSCLCTLLKLWGPATVWHIPPGNGRFSGQPPRKACSCRFLLPTAECSRVVG